MPIPNPKCEATLYSTNTWCTSIYLVAKENEDESAKLPPAVMDIAELPELTHGVENIESDSSEESENLESGQSDENTMAWVFSSLTLSFGLGVIFFSPLAGVLLVAWSIPFFPPMMLRLRRFVPFLKHRWERLGLLGIGFLLALLLVLLTQLADRKINTSPSKAW